MPEEHLGSERVSTRGHFELLTPVELAERLKVPTSWVRERTRSRDLNGNDAIPHLRLGRYIRFQWGSLNLKLGSADDCLQNPCTEATRYASVHLP
jgi:hypothetical protein